MFKVVESYLDVLGSVLSKAYVCYVPPGRCLGILPYIVFFASLVDNNSAEHLMMVLG